MMISRSAAEQVAAVDHGCRSSAAIVIAGAAFPACFPPASPELAVISVVVPRKLQMGQRLVQVGSRLNPTAAIYNRYKVVRPVIDRSGCCHVTNDGTMRAVARVRKIDSQLSSCVIRSAPASQTQETDSSGWGSMADGARHSRALILGASVSLSGVDVFSVPALAQTADAERRQPCVEQKKQKQSKRQAGEASRSKPQTPVLNARAQIGGTPVQSLDTITVAASKAEERAIDALAPVSVVTLEQIQGLQPESAVRHPL